MSCEEDSSLLFLIVQHLKMKGLLVAAEVLEEHVSQAEMPNTSLKLHDIYKGWMKLCSNKQHGEQSADEFDAPGKVEPEGGADERPSKDNNMDVEAPLASKTEDVERSNGCEHNGCRSLPPEQEEQTQQEQPEVVMDPPLELSVNQTEVTEATNDCSGDGGDTEGPENENGLKEHQEMFSASDVPPLADADIMTEPDKEVAEMEASVTAQSEQEDNQMGALESTDEDKMAAEQRDHLDVAITLNIDSGKRNAPLDEEVATPKKKKKKKTAVEDDQETEQANPVQNMKKGKKRKNEEKDHQEVEDDVAAPEEKKKRKKKRRRKKEEEEEGEGLGTEEVPCDEGVTGGGAELQEKLKEQDSTSSQLSSTQKRRRRRRLRLKKHARMQKQPDASKEHQTLPPEPLKRDVGDVTLEEGAWHERMMTTQEEISSKENQSSISITKKDKKKKKMAASEEKVDDACNFLEAVRQKKKKRAANEEAVQYMGNDGNAKDLLEVKRRKKNKKKEEEEEDAKSRETPVCSDSSANKKKKKKVKGKTMDDEDT
ncbi:glutamic acid-rich protein-like isoform X2 [Hippocampus zosterae]|uniref:glutamic acid-rich protein-like isoform X2 n=1 Tax=Hippocampus zosterae TaxID=109293 RepID=UPI00223CE1ED|nr:glutamic acid-rich protein-like isoform X2 [Hippocampus zosterae]